MGEPHEMTKEQHALFKHERGQHKQKKHTVCIYEYDHASMYMTMHP